MNLSDREKRLFSKVAIILVGLSIIAFSYWGLIAIIKKYNSNKEHQRQELIHTYESKMDSIKIINSVLIAQVDSLEQQVATIQGTKKIVIVETIKKDKEIKDASAVTHARAIDTLTGQNLTWSIVKDSISNDTIIKYNFTKPGVVKLRLTVNDLYKYKRLYNLNEEIISKQKSEINLQKTIIANDMIALQSGKDALTTSALANEKLTKQLNKAQKRSKRWPVWLGAGFIGGVVLCLSAQ